MSYFGLDRRVHTCFITKNREYHVRAGVCVAVRDRISSAWIAGHRAVGMKMRPSPPGSAFLGRALEFLEEDALVRTSDVVDILRPGRTVVETYNIVQCLSPI